MCDVAGAPRHAAAALQPRAGPGHQLRSQPALAPRVSGGGYQLYVSRQYKSKPLFVCAGGAGGGGECPLRDSDPVPWAEQRGRRAVPVPGQQGQQPPVL